MDHGLYFEPVILLIKCDKNKGGIPKLVGCGSDSIKTAGANEEGDVGKTEGSRAGAEASLAVLSGAEQEEEDKYGKICDGVVKRGLR